MDKNLDYDWLKKGEELISEDNSLTLWDQEFGKKVEIGFYRDRNSFGSEFLFLTSIVSYRPGERNFSRLFAHLRLTSTERGLEYFLLEVDYDNDEAIEIY